MTRALFGFIVLSLLLMPVIALAQDPVEQIYLGDGSSITAFDVTASQSYVASSEIINQGGELYENLYYDEIQDRLFYVAFGGGIYTLRYVYRHQADFASNETSIISATSSPAYSVDGTRDVLVLADNANSEFHVGLVENYTLYTIDNFTFDISRYATVRDVSMAVTKENKFYFSTNDNSMSKGALLFRYDPAIDPAGTPTEIVVDAADTNTSDQIYYDPKSHILYTLGMNQSNDNSLYAYDLSTNDTVESIIKIDYNQLNLYAIKAFVLRYVAGSIHYVIGTAHTTNDIYEDYDDGGGNRDIGDLVVKEANGRFVYGMAIDRECNNDNVDSDGDVIPDCKDPCPTDSANACNLLYFLNSKNINTLKTVYSHLAGTDGSPIAGRQAKEGFSIDNIDEGEIDTVNRVVLYTDAAGHVRRLNLDTQEDVQILEEGSSGDFVGAVADFTIDTFRNTAYMVVDDGLDNYVFYSFNYLDADPTVSPSILTVTIPMGDSLGGFVIDPRMGSTHDRTLYFSLGSMVYGYNLDTAGPKYDVLTVPIAGKVGDLALNYTAGLLYFYCHFQGDKGAVFEVPLTGSSENVNTLFIERGTPYNATIDYVSIYYHSHIDGGSGRVYVSNEFNTSKPLYFYNANDGSCDNVGCVVDSSFFNGASADRVRRITFRESCDCTKSLDSNQDGIPDCDTVGICSGDQCPSDPNKTAPGVCGCGVEDSPANIADNDGDTVANCNDACPENSTKTTNGGVCGCGLNDTTFNVSDNDSDGTPNCKDACPEDSNKITGEGVCGCGIADGDSDGDTQHDCHEECPLDPLKTLEGVCGCGVVDVDVDGDSICDLEEECTTDPNKTTAGLCGCGFSDVDSDLDDTPDCNDQCPNEPRRQFSEPCGCDASVDDTEDSDGDGFSDCNDACIDDPAFNLTPPICGCDVIQNIGDDDGDGVPNCLENCIDGTLEGCGCGIQDCSSVPTDPGDGPGNPGGGVLLTNLSALSSAPSQAAQGKRGIRLFLKKYGGVQLIEDTRSQRIAERRRKNKKNKKRNGQLKIGYEVIIKKLGSKQKIKRIVTNKNIVRLNRLKKGTYTIKYKAVIKRKKKTVSATNYSPSTSFKIPLR